MSVLTIRTVLRKSIKYLTHSFIFLYFMLQVVLIVVGLLFYMRDLKISHIPKH